MWSWLDRLGLASDRWLNVVLFGGSDTETVSHHAARRELQGARWACWTCWVLGVLVQRHHCAITLSPAPEARGAAIRAGMLMLVGVVLVVFLVHSIVRWS